MVIVMNQSKNMRTLTESAGKLSEIVAQCPKRQINIMRILSTWTDSTGFLRIPHFLKITELALIEVLKIRTPLPSYMKCLN